MTDFFHISDKEIILLSAAIAAVLADGLDADQENTLGNFLMCIGQDLVAASGQRAVFESEAKKIKEAKVNKK
ncbi:MAG: hypothetical protein FWD71_07575 [Oscillospiraceae bacterium]|nr:hypothetical protein [Oscillospiraceae bacterium]